MVNASTNSTVEARNAAMTTLASGPVKILNAYSFASARTERGC
jgi:hypothetical protein